MRSMVPVMASKPVAKTMQSTAYSSPATTIPAGVIRSTGFVRTSTRSTFGRL